MGSFANEQNRAGGSGTQADGPDAVARWAACRMVKARARRYALRPAALEALHPGLSIATPSALVALGQHLVARERETPRRWFGFGGEVGLVNAQAALLLGRLRRRQDRGEGAVPLG